MDYITNKKLVTIVYELRANSCDGDLIEQITRKNPFSFIYGSGKVLRNFEEKLNGLRVGDTFSFTLKAEDAYGNRNENAIMYVPIDELKLNGVIEKDLLSIGNCIPMSDDEGNEFEGTIIDVKKNIVIMDMNPALAGKDLFFSGCIIDIEDINLLKKGNRLPEEEKIWQ